MMWRYRPTLDYYRPDPPPERRSVLLSNLPIVVALAAIVLVHVLLMLALR